MQIAKQIVGDTSVLVNADGSLVEHKTLCEAFKKAACVEMPAQVLIDAIQASQKESLPAQVLIDAIQASQKESLPSGVECVLPFSLRQSSLLTGGTLMLQILIIAMQNLLRFIVVWLMIINCGQPT